MTAIASQSSQTKSEGHAAHTQDEQRQTGLHGQFYRPIKIAMLGAGSGFTPRLVSASWTSTVS